MEEEQKTKIEEKPEKIVETKKEEKKEPQKLKIKKTEAVVNALSLPLSTKQSVAICKFIKGKKIERAISDLEQVFVAKKVIPMRGEIPHRKGKGIMSGRYPKKASEQFIKLLKNLSANASVNELNNPIISNAIANNASRPHGKFGRVRKKRTHVKIIVIEKKMIKENK